MWSDPYRIGILPAINPQKQKLKSKWEILQSFSTSELSTTTSNAFPSLCVAVALASAAPEVSVPGRLSSQCSTALRTNLLPVCLSWPWITQAAQLTWLTPDTNDKWTPDRRMADTALKFGPEWLRALTEPQGGTDGGGEPDSSSRPCTSCC